MNYVRFVTVSKFSAFMPSYVFRIKSFELFDTQNMQLFRAWYFVQIALVIHQYGAWECVCVFIDLCAFTCIMPKDRLVLFSQAAPLLFTQGGDIVL